ncbi:MAG: outer membrane protein assembly factor BamD [Simkania sp.]|nr:outer membrane protein assembly factor BamD [Simkania sp.]
MIRSVFVILILSTPLIEAAYTFKEGKLIHSDELATMSVQEHHGAALEALHTRNWPELIRQATIITKNFPGTPFSQESYFFLGKGYLETQELDLANQYLSLYLKKQSVPKHFEEAMRSKLAIADQFHQGTKKHLMGVKSLPKWVSAQDESLKIYDEISTAMPNHEFAARALLGKALLLREEGDFKPAVENLQALIRRFPKHTLAAQAFMEIGQCYLKQAEVEFPDPDLLDLAEINLRKFSTEFPDEERVGQTKSILLRMQELFAKTLFDTAQFFERTKKPHAALIYYARILRDFSMTEIAQKAQVRTAVLNPKVKAPPVSNEIENKDSALLVDSSENIKNQESSSNSFSEETINHEETPSLSVPVSIETVENDQA